MSSFTGHVHLRLRFPIEVAATTLPDIVVPAKPPWRANTTLRPNIQDDKVTEVFALVHVDDPRIRWLHATVPVLDRGPDQLVLLAESIAFRALSDTLNVLAAATLQTELVRGLDDLDWHVVSTEWEMPDGRRIKPPKKIGSASYLLKFEVQDRAPVTTAEWSRAPNYLSGMARLPHWRSHLLDAYSAWWRSDLVGTVLRAATALEIGATPHLVDDFNINTLRQEFAIDRLEPALDQDTRELWYSRHGIIHRGQAMLYDRHPKSGVPIRPLNESDVRRFLAVVPKTIEFIES